MRKKCWWSFADACHKRIFDYIHADQVLVFRFFFVEVPTYAHKNSPLPSTDMINVFLHGEDAIG